MSRSGASQFRFNTPNTAMAWLGAGVVAALMWVLVEQLNPDWFGYEKIYAEGGSWLVDQGRDPLFVLLMSMVSRILGPDGYNLFRLSLSIYFSIFTYFLISGRLIPFDINRRAGIIFLLALLPLLIPRFTIQIREGLAMTFVVAALGLVVRREAQLNAEAITNRKSIRLFSLGAFSLMLMAILTHAGVAVIPICMVAAWMIHQVAQGSRSIESHILWACACVATCILSLLAIFVPNTTWGVRFISGAFGWLVEGRVVVSFEKWAYWAIYGLGLFTLVARVLSTGDRRAFGPVMRPFAGVIALVCLPALYFAALILLASGIPAIVISALSRSINLLVALLLLLIAFRTRLGLRLGLFSALVLVDQARIIAEAVFSTFDQVP